MRKWKVDGFTCTKSAQMGIIFALFLFFLDRVYFNSSVWANQKDTLVTEGFRVRSSSTDLSPKGSQLQVNQPLYQQKWPRIESRFPAFLLCSSFVFLAVAVVITLSVHSSQPHNTGKPPSKKYPFNKPWHLTCRPGKAVCCTRVSSFRQAPQWQIQICRYEVNHILKKGMQCRKSILSGRALQKSSCLQWWKLFLVTVVGFFVSKTTSQGCGTFLSTHGGSVDGCVSCTLSMSQLMVYSWYGYKSAERPSTIFMYLVTKI